MNSVVEPLADRVRWRTTTAHGLLRDATYGSDQLVHAIALFDNATERGASDPKTNCHSAVVDLYKR